MRIETLWIDATGCSSRLRVFGMPLVERILRGAAEVGLLPDETRLVLGEDDELPPLPDELCRRFGLRVERPTDGAIEALSRRRAELGGALLALRGDVVVDARVLAHLAGLGGNGVFIGSAGDASCAVLRLEAGPPLVASSWEEATRALLADGSARELRADDFPGYITMLRRDLPPYVVCVRDAHDVQRVERFLFWSNYKGSTDFMTRYVYPPFVWWMVRPLARWRVHPNWVTAVDIVATFAAIPYFMQGRWVVGLGLAYLMSVLDSVDGKLARVTFTSSRLGEVLDHGLDIVHPPMWYMAWGWALGGQQVASLPFQSTLWLLAMYVLDRVVAGVFKWRHGRSIHGFTPFDERMRTFISRRNVNLPFFTLALVFDAMFAERGWPAATLCLYAIVAWQGLCLLFHLERLVRFWGQGARDGAQAG